MPLRTLHRILCSTTSVVLVAAMLAVTNHDLAGADGHDLPGECREIIGTNGGVEPPNDDRESLEYVQWENDVLANRINVAQDIQREATEKRDKARRQAESLEREVGEGSELFDEVVFQNYAYTGGAFMLVPPEEGPEAIGALMHVAESENSAVSEHLVALEAYTEVQKNLQEEVDLADECVGVLAELVRDAESRSGEIQARAEAAEAQEAAERAAAEAAGGDGGGNDGGGGGGTAPGGGVEDGPVSGNRSAVLAAARSKIGLPYCYGGTGPSCYDCSGLVGMAYASVGISVPRVSGAIMAAGTPGPCRPGDAIGRPGHIAIYSGNGQMVEGPRTGLNVRETATRGGTCVRFIS